MFIPILLTLLVSTEQLGKLTYTYYSLRKALYTVARYVGTQQAVNFCDVSDPNITAGLNLATTGTSDGSTPPLINGFTADMISISAERYDPVGQTLSVCDCSNTGCDESVGGSAPDFIVVSIPNGFNFTPNIPFLPLDAIPLRPQVKVPYGGT
jgi:hypothetical protein